MQDAASDGLVDIENGLVSREAFTSDAVYRDELDRIFDRSWIFLAHESEIPEPGDYVTRQLGSAPVIVIRTEDDGVRALLNSCRHRGVRICRSDSGRAGKLVCPYHGWAYEADGRLISTGFDDHFPDGTDFSQFNLVGAPRLERKYGLIFGCWDPDVVSLDDYLGDVSWYLEAFLGRTPLGMEVLGPPHRWRVDANWKIGALNFIGDSQHVVTTHAGPISLDNARSVEEGFTNAGQDSFQVVTDQGHGCIMTYLAPGMPEANYQTHNAELKEHYEQTLSAGQIKMLRHLRVCVGNVFPNFSFIESQVVRGQKTVIIRVWQPTGGTSMEVLSWIVAERESSDSYKDNVLKNGFHNFGAAGVFEQDDMELWISATRASNNPIAARYPYNFQTALRYLETPVADHAWPGAAYRPSNTEVSQFKFMLHWDRVMQSNQAPRNER